jgi:hypothetical protein
MANTVGLIALANGMRKYFETYGISANIATCGWNQRPQILNQGAGQANRVLLIPGKQPSGSAGAGGTLTRDSRPSTTNPRALLTWRKDVTMSVWAVDTTDTHNEELQIAAAEQLLEYAIQAAHSAVDPDTNVNVGLAAIEWGSVRYTIPPGEMRFGNEILVEFVHKCPIFDQTLSLAYPQLAITTTIVKTTPVTPFITEPPNAS